ncbi:MAG TPA: MBL fold metallo-hydrolase [Terriglobia bacterium]|nr:MBL fold metallo-hydrolase [Terriglobia bacterium]
MTHKLSILFVVLSVMSRLAVGQNVPPGHVDPWPVLRAAAKAIGADNLKCVTFSGTGYAGKVGQNVTQDTDWPRGEPLENYFRTIDYDTRSSVERFTRKPGMNPRSWKYGTGWLGGTPLQQKERQTFVVSGNFAWHMDGEGANPIPAPASAELWQLDIWLNPPGFIKAAMAPGANPTAIWRWEMAESGRDGATTAGIEKVTIVSATVLGKYRVNATINSQNLIQRIQTWVPHPVLGDMNYEHEYTEWRDVGGVKFPAGWHHHDGWDDERQIPTISGGRNGFGGSFGKIEPNVCGPAITVPEIVRQGGVSRAQVETQKLADGVWLLAGSSHNSVAVEFKNYVAVVEAPLDEQRSLAVIAEIVKLVPSKPIRFVINTHAHYDHLGGLRTYLHVGATVITHQRNRVFYETELLNYVPRTLQPDMVSLYPPTEISEGYTMEDVDEKYVLTDGTRNLEIYYVQGLGAHVEGMLMAYLPKEKIVIEADLYDPPAADEPLPEAPSAVHRAFYKNVQQLGLDISTIAPIHGHVVPWSDFVKVVGKRD